MKKDNFNIINKNNKINLKINLEDVPISPKLNNFKSLSVTELINQPGNVKRKIFSIASFANTMKKGLLNTSSMMRGDLNRTEADLTPFNGMEILSETNFSTNPLDSSRSSYSNSTNKSNISNKTSKSNNSFKILIKEDYSGFK